MMYLKVSAIFKYLDATPMSRCFIEGEALLEADHIVLCGIKEKSANAIKIVSYCLRSIGMKNDPHEICGVLKICADTSVEIENFQCTCKAGSSMQCKHVVATLLYCSRKPVKEFEVLSGTDLKCAWKNRKPKAEAQYMPTPLCKSKCFEAQMKKQPLILSQDLKQKIMAEVLATCPDSAVSLHIKGRRNKILNAINSENSGYQSTVVPQYITTLLENAEKSQFLQDLQVDINLEKQCCQNVLQSLESDNILQGLTCEQGSVEWKYMRQNRITGTTCYSIFTYGRNDWHKKSKAIFRPKIISTKQMKFGNDVEPVAREAFQAANPNHEVKTVGLVISKKYPWLAYSPDGIIFKNQQPTGLLEIKCPFDGKTKSHSDVLPKLSYLNSDLTLKKKHSYYGQIQFGMALLNLKVCEFVIYFAMDKSFLNITIPFDIEFATALIETISTRYFSHMIHYICLLKEGDTLSEEKE